MKLGNWLRSLTLVGKVMTMAVLAALIWGGVWAHEKFFPKPIKKSIAVTGIDIPPLTYDKNANAPVRNIPEFDSPADIAGKEIRGHLMGWNAVSALSYAVGGKSTSVGSLCQELGLNVKLDVQNSTTKQGEDLYAFAQELHDGNPNPSKGCHFVNWMGDGCPKYLTNLNKRLSKDFGDEYRAEVIYFSGISFGEDKLLVKPKYKKDTRGALICTVVADGDWNIAMKLASDNGWKVNHDLSTYDPEAVNFVSAPNDDYIEAAKFYISGQKVTLKLVKDGKLTGRDTTLSCTGVSTWFPADYLAVKEKGGLVTAISTKEYSAQMPCALIFIKKWADDNKPVIEKFIEAVAKGGDQVKSHDGALQFACKVNQLVFADQNMSDQDYYNAFKSFDFTDDDGNVVNVGGSRVFNLADAAQYCGISGGSDKYKAVYETFGKIDVSAYPEQIPDFAPYEQAVDLSFLRSVYSRLKSEAGTASKPQFSGDEKLTKVVSNKAVTIEFEIGSATIKASSKKMIDDEIVSQLLIADNLLVEIGGHTDNTGTPEGNRSLSQARAQAVRDYIVSKDPTEFSPRITFKGYGQDIPIADNSTAQGKQKNRRVEIKLGK